MSATMTTTETATATAPRKIRTNAPKVSFASINPNNLGTLRKLNHVLFPVRYTEQFYKDVLLPEHEDYCKLVYYNDIPVGTICGRIEKGDTEQEAKLYIMTMGVLAPYRSLSLGTQALQTVVSAVAATQAQTPEAPGGKSSSNTTGAAAAGGQPGKQQAAANGAKKPVIKTIYLHVQVSNADAKRFYERNEFVEVGKIEGYYRKIEPRDAWVLERKIHQ